MRPTKKLLKYFFQTASITGIKLGSQLYRLDINGAFDQLEALQLGKRLTLQRVKSSLDLLRSSLGQTDLATAQKLMVAQRCPSSREAQLSTIRTHEEIRAPTCPSMPFLAISSALVCLTKLRLMLIWN